MKKQQIILISGATVLFCIVFFFGRTVPIKTTTSPATQGEAKETSFNVEKVLEASRAQLTPSQQAHVTKLESAVVRGNVKTQQAAVYKQLAEFYKDSAQLLLPFAYYTGEAAKLENSEKSLTFAARFFLNNVRSQQDPGLKKWMAGESKELFEKALLLDPSNDSLKIGLGSCYLFGNISETPMQGILMIREVAQRDPSNMYAQFMLGIGGMLSGQLDRAIERLKLVATNEPDNVEAELMLAEAYEKKGDKPNAAKWYEAVKRHINNPDVVKEIDARIELLRK